MYYTLLVNKNNSIKQNVIDRIVMSQYNDCFGNMILVEKECLKSFLELKDYFLKKNIIIEVDSAFRTFDEQDLLRKILEEEKGREYLDKYVSRSGESEHHTGLALDIVVRSGELEEDESLYLEVHKKLHEFGFILRYPMNKENITGYSYEAWHIRYVGRVPAKIIYEKDLTLEEYLTKFGCVLYINKKVGVTSFDVVNEISHIFGIKRVGHTGTLDPMASGVLIVCVGACCKIVELLTSRDKEYVAGVELGVSTDTLDITGTVVDKCEVRDIDIEKVLSSFKKTYMQEVPIYSAVKVNGKKLYEYARNNIDVVLPKKKVTIKEIELLDKVDLYHFTFRCIVTKGCYIRSLIRDIGESISIYAIMSSLVRTRQGVVSINDTNSIEDIKNNNFTYHSILDVLDYPVIIVDSSLKKRLRNGVKIKDKWNIKDKVIFIDSLDRVIGIFEKNGDMLKTWKNF